MRTEKLKDFFSSHKGKAYTDAFFSLSMFALGVILVNSANGKWLSPMMFFNAMIFAWGSGMALCRHVTDQIIASKDRIIDMQDEVIENLHDLIELGRAS